jgi:hypothetical protein
MQNWSIIERQGLFFSPCKRKPVTEGGQTTLLEGMPKTTRASTQIETSSDRKIQVKGESEPS